MSFLFFIWSWLLFFQGLWRTICEDFLWGLHWICRLLLVYRIGIFTMLILPSEEQWEIFLFSDIFHNFFLQRVKVLVMWVYHFFGYPKIFYVVYGYFKWLCFFLISQHLYHLYIGRLSFFFLSWFCILPHYWKGLSAVQAPSWNFWCYLCLLSYNLQIVKVCFLLFNLNPLNLFLSYCSS